MQTTPRIGEPGNYVTGTGAVRAARVIGLNTDGTVDAETARVASGALSFALEASKPYVAIGGTPPGSGGYFQQVDYSA